MAKVTTTKPVNLPQLSAEMGGKALGSATQDGGTVVQSYDSTTNAALQAAVDAHVASFPADAATTAAANAAVAQMVVAAKATAGTLTPAQAVQVAAAFPLWGPGVSVAAGDLRYYAGTLVQSLQAHTTQADWTPPQVPALWKVYRDPAAVTEWVQPIGSTDAYAKGAKVTHNGKTWTSNVAANVWEPPTQWTQV